MLASACSATSSTASPRAACCASGWRRRCASRVLGLFQIARRGGLRGRAAASRPSTRSSRKPASSTWPSGLGPRGAVHAHAGADRWRSCARRACGCGSRRGACARSCRRWACTSCRCRSKTRRAPTTSGKIDGFIAVPTAALAFQWSTQARYMTRCASAFLHRLPHRRASRVRSAAARDAAALRAAGAKAALRLQELGQAAGRGAARRPVHASRGSSFVPVSRAFSRRVLRGGARRRAKTWARSWCRTRCSSRSTAGWPTIAPSTRTTSDEARRSCGCLVRARPGARPSRWCCAWPRRCPRAPAWAREGTAFARDVERLTHGQVRSSGTSAASPATSCRCSIA